MPQEAGPRVFVGLVSGMLWVGAEVVCGKLSGNGGAWVWETDAGAAAGVGAASLLLFAAMPCLLMLFEKGNGSVRLSEEEKDGAVAL